MNQTVTTFSIRLMIFQGTLQDSSYRFLLCSQSQNELEVQNGKMEEKNAVRIQISTAFITYCLVAIVLHNMQLKLSTYEVL